MRKQILIVDDDKQERLFIQNELKNYEHLFSVLMARDGLEAIEYVRRNPIALVITDIHMPRMDGIRLLVYMTEHFPDIPVLINIGYSGQDVGRQVQENGAEGFIEKPIHTPTLVNQIQSVLNRQTNGGTLRDVSTGTFLQMLEMESRSCTVRVMENHSETQGSLFVRKGKLVDARSNGSRGRAAAFKILAWDDVTLFIQNNCPDTKENIHTNLQALLLESMRIKDEKETENPAPAPKAPPRSTPRDAHRVAQKAKPPRQAAPEVVSKVKDSSIDELFDEFLPIEEAPAQAPRAPQQATSLPKDAPLEQDESLDDLLDDFQAFEKMPGQAQGQQPPPAQQKAAVEDASLNALFDDFQPFENAPGQAQEQQPPPAQQKVAVEDASLNALLDDFQPFESAPGQQPPPPQQKAAVEDASLNALFDEFQPFENAPAQPQDQNRKQESRTQRTHQDADALSLIKRKLELKAGKRCGLNDIYQDASWNAFINGVKSIEPFLDAGSLNVGFISKGTSNDFFLLAGKVPTVVAVEPNCMRDKIMSTLCDEYSVK
jgi:CheY-like chemotaxis protein